VTAAINTNNVINPLEMPAFLRGIATIRPLVSVNYFSNMDIQENLN